MRRERFISDIVATFGHSTETRDRGRPKTDLNKNRIDQFDIFLSAEERPCAQSFRTLRLAFASSITIDFPNGAARAAVDVLPPLQRPAGATK
jgi:hypothetical protein